MSRSTVTLKEIAESVGCSPMVVSVVLNPTGSNVRVSESTRERVLLAAANMGYRRNEVARAMATGKTRVVGLMAPTFESEMQVETLVGAEEVAGKHGYLLKLLRVPREEEKVRVVVEQCASQMLSGVIGISISDLALKYLECESRAHDFPVVLIEEAPRQDWAWHLASDDSTGIRETVEKLLSWGHRNFALLSGPASSLAACQRRETFLAILAEHGINLGPDAAFEGDWWDPEVNQPLITRLLSAPQRPTALLCPSDWAAMAGLRAARKLGLDVPRQLSIVGFGDHKFSHFADPPLSSIHQQFQEMGGAALNCLMESINHSNGSAPAPRFIAFPTHLRLRQSTGPAPI